MAHEGFCDGGLEVEGGGRRNALRVRPLLIDRSRHVVVNERREMLPRQRVGKHNFESRVVKRTRRPAGRTLQFRTDNAAAQLDPPTLPLENQPAFVTEISEGLLVGNSQSEEGDVEHSDLLLSGCAPQLSGCAPQRLHQTHPLYAPSLVGYLHHHHAMTASGKRTGSSP